ncbi:MAG: hypothetical protein JSV66_06015 [Trueperaceae bacterium]|nr:MAG: hypothetical protein JSV66_06015 [Trueperaceae bacterium]
MPLLAGVGRVTITPPPDIPNGMWMAQTHVRARGVHQDLWLTVAVVRDDDESLVILDIDWCILSDDQVASVRRAVAEVCSLPTERILPVCTHNHAGPVTQETYSGEGADQVADYIARLPGWAAAASREAIDGLQPVRVAAGSGHSEIGINRDLYLTDGRVVAGPNPDGFADRSVGVIRLERYDGSPLAIVVNYACHPTVLGPKNVLVSPDYPGATKRTVERLTGATCLFLQGAAGDMGPVKSFVGDPSVAERLGTLLGLEAAKVALSLDARPVRSELAGIVASGAPLTVYAERPTGEPEPRLRHLFRHVALPLRSPLPEVLAGAERRASEWQEALRLRREQGADPEAIAHAHQNLERERLRALRHETFASQQHHSIEMHAVALGPVALLFSWGEPYAYIGVDIKTRSPWAQTFFCGYLAGDPMYIVSPQAYREPTPFQFDNCPFKSEAGEIVVESALELLGALAQA